MERSVYGFRLRGRWVCLKAGVLRDGTWGAGEGECGLRGGDECEFSRPGVDVALFGSGRCFEDIL